MGLTFEDTKGRFLFRGLNVNWIGREVAEGMVVVEFRSFFSVPDGF